MANEAYEKLVSRKKTWIGWNRDKLIQTFGQPLTRNGSNTDEWLGFKVDACSITVHIVGGKVVSAEVWAGQDMNDSVEPFDQQINRLLADGKRMAAKKMYMEVKGVTVQAAEIWLTNYDMEKKQVKAVEEVGEEILELLINGKKFEAQKLFCKKTGKDIFAARKFIEELSGETLSKEK